MNFPKKCPVAFQWRWPLISGPLEIKAGEHEAVRQLMNTFKVDGLTRALTRQL